MRRQVGVYERLSEILADYALTNGTDQCWEWRRSVARGYGGIHVPGQGRRCSHRVVWEFVHGKLPGDHLVVQLDHLCRNRLCINPRHLEPVTPYVNSMRSGSPATINAMKAYCQNGHRLTGRNVHLNAGGARVCRACARDRYRGSPHYRGYVQNQRKTHCKHGHEFTQANTCLFQRKRGRMEYTERVCRTCMNAAQRRCHQRKHVKESA